MVTSTSSTSFPQSRPAVARPLDRLRSHIAGLVVTRDDEQYDDARKVHDFTVDRRPLAIIRAAGAADVAEAVRFAREHEYPFTVRSGGHSLAAQSVIDGALVIDLSGMKAVTIDPVARTARVQAGVTSGDLAGPAHAYGLALSTGDASSVGLGGLTTGGGIGFMARKHGLAIDNLLSAQVVTAEGEIIKTSPRENEDLFWAIRGGGGNFGIITEFEFRMAPVGQVYGGVLALPGTPEVLRGYLDYIVKAPDDLTTIANLMHAPPAPFIPAHRIGELALMVLVTWTGDAEDGKRALAPLRALAEPIADAVDLIPYPAMYRFTEASTAPHGAAIRSMFSHGYSDGTIDAVIAAMESATSPVSMVQFRGLGGAIARVGNGETAYSHRDKPYFMAVLGLWMDPQEDGTPHRQWVETLWAQVRGDATGVYVNFLGDEGAARIAEAYPAETYSRLVETKAKYDPDNVFRFNQNIRPRG